MGRSAGGKKGGPVTVKRNVISGQNKKKRQERGEGAVPKKGGAKFLCRKNGKASKTFFFLKLSKWDGEKRAFFGGRRGWGTSN